MRLATLRLDQSTSLQKPMLAILKVDTESWLVLSISVYRLVFEVVFKLFP